MKLHLVDGTYELFRAYFGAPSSTDDQGREVGATRALAATLAKLLGRGDVTHVAVAFDHVIESFRNDLFAGYKTGAGLPEDLTSQFEPAEQVSRALGLATWPMVEFEADDALATAAARWGDDVDQVVICSPDKDLGQCVRGHRVVLWDRRRDLVYDEAAIEDKFGVRPASIPDYLALVGDKADGIPGVPRWGAKSASTLLARYGAIEAIPPDPAAWQVKVRGAAGLSERLEARRDDALLYKTLATLRDDVPLAEALDDLRWRGADREALEPLLGRIGGMAILERLPAP